MFLLGFGVVFTSMFLIQCAKLMPHAKTIQNLSSYGAATSFGSQAPRSPLSGPSFRQVSLPIPQGRPPPSLDAENDGNMMEKLYKGLWSSLSFVFSFWFTICDVVFEALSY